MDDEPSRAPVRTAFARRWTLRSTSPEKNALAFFRVIKYFVLQSFCRPPPFALAKARDWERYGNEQGVLRRPGCYRYRRGRRPRPRLFARDRPARRRGDRERY